MSTVQSRSNFKKNHIVELGLAKKVLFPVLISVALACLIEILLFNFTTLQSISYGFLPSTSAMTSIEERIFTIEGSGDSDNGLNEDKDEQIILPLGGVQIKNLAFNFLEAEPVLSFENVQDGYEKTKIEVWAKDEGHAQFYILGSLKAELGQEFFDIEAYGNIQELKLIVQPNQNTTVFSVAFNKFEPLHMSAKRIAALFLVIILIYTLRPSSSLWRKPYYAKGFIRAMAILTFAATLILVVTQYNPLHLVYEPHLSQYSDFAAALADGSFVLKEAPPEILGSLDNPYDYANRTAEGIVYKWDHAFYDGNYYMYFGVLPMIFFHLPYYLITGQSLDDVVPIAICLSVFSLGLVCLLKSICQRWFEECSQGGFLIGIITLYLGSWIIFCGKYAWLYAVPISMALMFLVWGLALWIHATETEKVNIPETVAGAICMALVYACRPNLMIGCLLAIPLVVFCIRRKSIGLKKAILIAAIPFICVICLVGLYNALRFGSPFDFGANYNLTNNDMTHRGFNIDRLPIGIYMNLFQPVNASPEFPWLREAAFNSADYHGATIASKMYGGVFMLTPLLFCVALLFFRRIRKDMSRQVLCLAISSLLIGFILMIFDINAAGIIARYFSDYGIFFAIAAALCCLSAMNRNLAENRSKGFILIVDGKNAFSIFGGIVTFLTVLSVILALAWLFSAPLRI